MTDDFLPVNSLAGIRNFLQLEERLGTSGMPKPEDFAVIAREGFEIVINLAMPTSDNAMPNEGDLVTRAGMSYIHIPVNFESPRPDDFERFSRLMELWSDRRLYIHCAANMRVSAFVFLHRVLRGRDREQAERDLRRIWNPDGVWREFIDRHLLAAGHKSLS